MAAGRATTALPHVPACRCAASPASAAASAAADPASDGNQPAERAAVVIEPAAGGRDIGIGQHGGQGSGSPTWISMAR